MFQNELVQVLRRADESAEALFDADEVERWSEGALERFVSLGIMKETNPARSIVCQDCDEACIEEIEFIDDRAYVICHQREDIGRIPIPLDRLRRWRVDILSLTQIVAGELGIQDPIKVLKPERLLGLGITHISERRADIFLARGISWCDSQEVFGQSEYLKEPTIPIVLMLSSANANLIFPPHAKSLSLPRLLSIDRTGLKVDISEVEQVIGKIRAGRVQNLIPFRTKPGTSWKNIVIEFVNDEEVRITDGTIADHRVYTEMGFSDRRSGQPNKPWDFLLAIAHKDGRFDWESLKGHSGLNPGLVRRRVSDTGLRLKAIFPGIEGSPFEAYRLNKSYQTRFILRWSAEMHERSGL